MNRYRAYFPRDETPIQEADGRPLGDDYFIGIQRRLDPSQLERGRAWFAENKRFDDKCAATRKGVRKMGWTNQSDETDPGLVIPFATIHGAGVFSDPDTGEEWQIVAAAGKCYKLHENTTSTELSLPPGVTLTGRVTFVQAHNRLYMFRGETLNWLRLDSLATGFIDPADTLDSGSVRLPNAESAVFHQNRIFVPYQRDSVFMSNIQEEYEGALVNVQTINQGSADKLVAIYKFNDTTLICAKENSIYVLANVFGADDAIAQNVVLDSVTNEYGCIATKSFVQVGNDVWFLAHNRGIMSIRQTEQNKLQGIDVPGSYDIQPIINRINWQYAANVVAANWNNKVYFAVPLDDATKKFAAIAPTGATPTYTVSGLILGRDYYYEAGVHDTSIVNGTQTLTESQWFTATAATAVITVSTGTSPGTVQPGFRGYNNAVLVYDLLNQAWAGYDTGDYGSSISIAVREWLKFHYAGDIRLGFVSDDGFLSLYEDGFLDMTGNAAGLITHHSIQDKLVTRGYAGSVGGFKEFKHVRANISTWWPTYSIKANTDGVRESRNLTPTPVTRDRTKYHFPFDQAPFDPSNANDDYLVSGREDYSTALQNSETIDFKSGVDLDLHQEVEDAYRLGDRGRYLQVTFEGLRGRTVIRSTELEAHSGARGSSVKA